MIIGKLSGGDNAPVLCFLWQQVAFQGATQNDTCVSWTVLLPGHATNRKWTTRRKCLYKTEYSTLKRLHIQQYGDDKGNWGQNLAFQILV